MRRKGRGGGWKWELTILSAIGLRVAGKGGRRACGLFAGSGGGGKKEKEIASISLTSKNQRGSQIVLTREKRHVR